MALRTDLCAGFFDCTGNCVSCAIKNVLLGAGCCGESNVRDICFVPTGVEQKLLRWEPTYLGIVGYLDMKSISWLLCPRGTFHRKKMGKYEVEDKKLDIFPTKTSPVSKTGKTALFHKTRKKENKNEQRTGKDL